MRIDHVPFSVKNPYIKHQDWRRFNNSKLTYALELAKASSTLLARDSLALDIGKVVLDAFPHVIRTSFDGQAHALDELVAFVI